MLNTTSGNTKPLKGPLKVCILNGGYELSNSPCKGVDVLSDPRPYLPKDFPWEWDLVLLDKANSFTQIQELKKKNYDLYFNHCDGAVDEDRAGDDVIKALEHFNLPYTGCDAKFFNLTKKTMKSLCTSSGIKTPRYTFVYSDNDIEPAINQIKKFPMIVKHHNSYSSVGMTQKCKVYNETELKEQAKIMIDNYGGALVEEFIEGREFTVLVFENPNDAKDSIALEPIEFLFAKGNTFKHFDQKHITYMDMRTKPMETSELNRKLMQMGKEAFFNMRGTSYGRLDVRVDSSTDEPYFLEVNAMGKMFCPPDEMGSSDFIIQHSKDYDVEKIVYLLAELGFKAHAKRQKPYHTSFRDLHGGLGLFAKSDIKQGELIISEEQMPKYTVVKKSAERNLKGTQNEWFKVYSYSIGPDLNVVYSPNPEDWLHITHSGEPNMCFDTEDNSLYARSNIRQGEEITMDYSKKR